jgi:hypothetical protein
MHRFGPARTRADVLEQAAWIRQEVDRRRADLQNPVLTPPPLTP